jgi:hypothetical protein
MMWEEVVMAYFKASAWHVTAGSEECYEGDVMIPIIRAEVWTQYIPNIKQEC